MRFFFMGISKKGSYLWKKPRSTAHSFSIHSRSQPPLLRPPSSRGRRENALFPYRHFERKREIFFVRGQATAVREAGNGKHRASCDWGSRCFMQTDLRRKTANGKRKRSLGCARDDETRKRFPPIPFQSTAEPTSAPSVAFFQRKEGECRFPRIVISSESEKSFSFAVR